MQCPRCHAQNSEGRRFCAECGTSLGRACRSCGFANEPEAEFCGGCGERLGRAEKSPSPHPIRRGILSSGS